MRQTQASSNPLDPGLIARRAKKHLDELEVIISQGAVTGSNPATNPPRRGPTTRRSISTLTRLMAQLKVRGVADGELPDRP